MKKILFFVLLISALPAMAQKHGYETSYDEKNGSLVFKGNVTLADLYMERDFNWMRTGVDEYIPAPKAQKILCDQLRKYKMVVFLGTWCSDSQDLIPKLYKVLDKAKYPLHDITIYGVDREKTTGDGKEKTYEITYVPTIILLYNGKEIGRITESVDKSIEEDLAAIITKHYK